LACGFAPAKWMTPVIIAQKTIEVKGFYRPPQA
jgi:hypothetical protein